MQPEPSGARVRRRVHPAVGPLLLGAAGIGAAVLVHVVDPHEPGNFPTCPWLLLTGTFCPGCGTMRAVNALTNLDLVGALAMNPLMVALLPLAAVAYARWLLSAFRPGREPAAGVRPFWLWLFLAVIVVFWVVRNLPFGAVLAPGS